MLSNETTAKSRRQRTGSAVDETSPPAVHTR